MTTSTRTPNSGAAVKSGGAMDDSKQMWASGGLIAAASLMFILGVFHFFSGIAAFFRNTFYVVGTNYPYAINTHAWGWIHVIGGVILAATGLALFGGRTWARWLAIGLVTLSAVANFFFIPYYPLWALTMLALDVFVIWAIASANVGTRAQGMAGQTGAMDTSRERASMGGSAYSGMNDNQPQNGQPQYARTGQRWPENAQQDATGRHWAGDAKEGTGARQVDAMQGQSSQDAMQGQSSQPGNNMGGKRDRSEQYAGRATGQAGSMSEDVTARARRQAEDAARKGGNS